jgi:hypothetical protein
LTNYAGLTGLTLDSSGNINIPTNLTLGYLNSAKTLTIGSITAYSFPASPSDTISIGITTPVAFYLYAGMYVTISLTSNPVFNGRYKILNILSSSSISIENPAGILQGTTSLGGNLDFGYIGANDLVASGTITANQVVPATQTNSASASVTLSNTSAQYQVNTRVGGATYILPNATTIPVGTVFHFNANSAGSVVIQDYATTTLYTMPNGAIVEAINLTNATSAGTWDLHAFAPSNATWGTANLAYSGNVSISGATRKISVQGTHLWSGAGNLGGNIVLGNSTSGDNLTGAGINNTIMGTDAGNALTTGTVNVLIGQVAGSLMTTGSNNVAVGAGAMAIGAVTGSSNVAVGINAGNGITSGAINTYVGGNAGVYSVQASGNVGVGAGALANASGSTANNNTAIGRDALSGIMTTGTQNIGIGYNTGVVTTGNNNTLIGQACARSLTTGSGNICIGYDVGNTAPLLTTGNYSTYIGYGANSLNGTSTGELVLGQAKGNGNSSLTIGANTNLVYISGWTTNGTLQITGGQITTISDKRAKENIVYIPTGGHIETLMKMKPVEFKLKRQEGKEKYVGFIADDLMEVIPNCVDGKKYQYEWEKGADGRTPKTDEDGNLILQRDANGELIPRYKALDWNEITTRAILAVQEQHAIITDLKAQLASLKATVDALVAQKEILVV